MEQKKAKIEIYLNEDGKIETSIVGNGIDLLAMMMSVIDQDQTFRSLIYKAAELLSIMKN